MTDQFPVRTHPEEPVEQLSRTLQFFDGLEERDESDAGDVLMEVDQPGFAGKDRRGQDIVDALGHADDVRLDHRPEPIEGCPDRVEGSQGRIGFSLELGGW